jgi:putative oxidoreductase
MHQVLGRYSDWIYGVMRIMVGSLFFCHGAQKMLSVFGAHGMVTDPKLIVAGVVELVCGGLVALGLGAGYAAFIASGEMCIAYFWVHAPGGFWPIMNKGELAVLYCFVFLYISSKGAGPISLDRLLWKKKRPA